MIPIRDHNPATRTPIVTYGLLALNIVIFLAYVPLFSDERAIGQLYLNWGIIPARVVSGSGFETLVTSMFLHGGWMHLIGNMLFLHIFGDNLEERLGHLGFAVFYLVAGVGAGLIQIMADPGSVVPVVGASGAIAGVMGGYLLMYPKARIDIFIFLIIIIRVIPVPAWIVLGVWFGLQVLNGLGSAGDIGGVAYWAHAGGFALGVILMLPAWLRSGGPAFWIRSHGHPENPEAKYKLSSSRLPKVARRHRMPPAQNSESRLDRVPRVPRRRP